MGVRTSKRLKQPLLMFVVAIIFVAGGWTIYSLSNADQTDKHDDKVARTVPEVNSKEDLNKVEDHLQSTDIDKELDTSEIDAVLSTQ